MRVDHLLRWLPFTREGLVWFLISVGMLVTGLLKSINLVTFLACWMVVLVSWNAWRAGRQLRPSRVARFFPEPLFAQTPCPMLLEMHNDGRRPVYGLGVADADQAVYAPEVAAGQMVSLPATVQFPRRGPQTLAPLQIACGHPLGLVRLTKTMPAGDAIVVFPRLGTLHLGLLRRILHQYSPTLGQARTVPRHHAGAQMEFHGLRPFVPGDSPRLVHWRTSARLGELMVREFADCPNEHLVLVIEPVVAAASEGADPLLERLLSLAATVCWEWCRQKGERIAVIFAGNPPAAVSGITGQPFLQRVLQLLALANGVAQVDDAALAATLQATDLPPGPVLVLSARAAGAAPICERTLNRPIAAISLERGDEQAFFEL